MLNPTKKALVISGGGAKGAWAGGVIEFLLKEKNKDWDVVIGTSTGSLLSPLSSIGEIDRLKQEYTSVNNKSIFNIEPYNKRGKFRILNAIWRVILGKKSLGEAKNLKKKIKKVITLEDYQKINKLKKEVIAVVTNMTTSTIEYKSQKDGNYDDFCDWLFTSCSVPILFDVIDKNGFEYLDGGILEPVPLQKAIDMGVTEIDVIILSSNEAVKFPKMKNVLNVILRTLDVMNKEITKDDILLGKLKSESNNIKINIYRTPFSLTKNSILFNKEEMEKWWKMGYDFAKDNTKCFILQKIKTSKFLKIKEI